MTSAPACCGTGTSRGPWLKALARGCELAQADPAFARTGGGYFGGLDVRPFGILGQMWVRVVQDLALAWPRFLSALGEGRPVGFTAADLVEWQAAWSRSLVSDPLWHARWTLDMQRKWVRFLSMTGRAGEDPRFAGVPQS